MNSLKKWLLENITSSLFWENGKLMLIFCGIISSIFLVVLAIVTKGFKQLSWKLWLPAIVCIPVIIFGFIMTLFPNGTGGVTQHFYLGIMLYALCTLIFTGIEEIIILLFLKLCLNN